MSQVTMIFFRSHRSISPVANAPKKNPGRIRADNTALTATAALDLPRVEANDATARKPTQSRVEDATWAANKRRYAPVKMLALPIAPTSEMALTYRAALSSACGFTAASATGSGYPGGRSFLRLSRLGLFLRGGTSTRLCGLLGRPFRGAGLAPRLEQLRGPFGGHVLRGVPRARRQSGIGLA